MYKAVCDKDLYIAMANILHITASTVDLFCFSAFDNQLHLVRLAQYVKNKL